ncbi:hypothetical protein CRM22_005299 [Opisthorchis felineus]|uniref:Uncharacterized protein n=1 Tax=Opisthorchis felineus TaxID=147828 RepID=A0A4S2LYY3_OPIFE|nr:hypothetical protein CRM22_005299 [Opisthorchis felineus]
MVVKSHIRSLRRRQVQPKHSGFAERIMQWFTPHFADRPLVIKTGHSSPPPLFTSTSVIWGKAPVHTYICSLMSSEQLQPFFFSADETYAASAFKSDDAIVIVRHWV